LAEGAGLDFARGAEALGDRDAGRVADRAAGDEWDAARTARREVAGVEGVTDAVVAWRVGRGGEAAMGRAGTGVGDVAWLCIATGGCAVSMRAAGVDADKAADRSSVRGWTEAVTAATANMATAPQARPIRAAFRRRVRAGSSTSLSTSSSDSNGSSSRDASDTSVPAIESKLEASSSITSGSLDGTLSACPSIPSRKKISSAGGVARDAVWMSAKEFEFDDTAAPPEWDASLLEHLPYRRGGEGHPWVGKERQCVQSAGYASTRRVEGA
jgi:hypothetical protein